MNIQAITPSNRDVRIIQFVPLGSEVFAVTTDEDGDVAVLPAEQLTIVDREYL